jgi:hypothetical protein
MLIWFTGTGCFMSSPLTQDLAVVFEGFDAGFNNDLEKGRELCKFSQKYPKASLRRNTPRSFVGGADGVQGARTGRHPVSSSGFGHRGVHARCSLQSDKPTSSTQEEYMQQAITALGEAETKARAQIKAAKSAKSATRFPAGTEWEVVQADALVLQGLTHALSESYMGYLSCLWVSSTSISYQWES